MNYKSYKKNILTAGRPNDKYCIKKIPRVYYLYKDLWMFLVNNV